jgi:hypothetical protein
VSAILIEKANFREFLEAGSFGFQIGHSVRNFANLFSANERKRLFLSALTLFGEKCFQKPALRLPLDAGFFRFWACIRAD